MEETVQTPPKWRPLSSMSRRVLGVLIEKAKTTPAAYPLSLNAIVTGCNQKSNRDPVMSLTDSQVEQTLEELRGMGAVGEVQGASRVPKYRHYVKDWMVIEGDEVAVMAELLLRGTQTAGELRGRAARMADGIADVAALKPTLASLMHKGLVVSLTPEGRGQVVTHALYLDREMAAIKAQYAGGGVVGASPLATVSPAAAFAPGAAGATMQASTSESGVVPGQTPGRTASPGLTESGDAVQLREEIRQLRADVERLKQEVEDLWSNLR